MSSGGLVLNLQPEEGFDRDPSAPDNLQAPRGGVDRALRNVFKIAGIRLRDLVGFCPARRLMCQSKRRYTGIQEKQMKSVLIYQMAGPALLGLSGSQSAYSLHMTMPTQAALAGFAIAILLLCCGASTFSSRPSAPTGASIVAR